MAIIHPLAAWRPLPEYAAEVAALPYDVLSSQEARALAAECPNSFLYVTKPEIAFREDQAFTREEVYQAGKQALERLVSRGVLLQEEVPALYIYQLERLGRKQTGIVGAVTTKEYQDNLIRKHEFTRPDKEVERLEHMRLVRAHTGMVFLVHRTHKPLQQLVQQVISSPPVTAFTAVDGIGHRLWVLKDPALLGELSTMFTQISPLYIADGHHRAAAANRLGLESSNPHSPKKRFLAAIFPEEEVQILPYNRVVRDLAGHTPESFIEALKTHFTISVNKMEPLEPHTFNMYLRSTWYILKTKPAYLRNSDLLRNLDVNILQNLVLAPILKIQDPRRDQRLDFVGGIRGEAELVKLVDQHSFQVAFSLYPTSFADLAHIADMGEVMPPKSTWFEPKLRDGLFVHRF